MKVLFYCFKNVHIPLFEPIIHWLCENSDVEILASSPAYNLEIREGLNPKELEYLKSLPLRYIDHKSNEVADVAVMADCVAGFLKQHKFIVNIGHGLISKGQYFSASPLIGRENNADMICVPGPYHKSSLAPHLFIPIEITGMSKLDVFYENIDKIFFLEKAGVKTSRKIILWAPTFNEELTSEPIMRESIKELSKKYFIVIKMHGSTNEDVKSIYKSISINEENIYFEEEFDINSWMKVSDLMVSDVSSVVFEYMALNKPIVLVDNPLQHTYKNYNAYDVEYRFRNMGPVVTNASDLIDSIHDEMLNPNNYEKFRMECQKAMFPTIDGRNTERISKVILKADRDLKSNSKKYIVLDGIINNYPQLKASLINNNLKVQIISTKQMTELDDDQFVLVITTDVSLPPDSNWDIPFKALFSGYKEIDHLGFLNSSDNPILDFKQYLKLDKYSLPESVKVEYLQNFILQTNVGEVISIPNQNFPNYFSKVKEVHNVSANCGLLLNWFVI